MKQKAIETMLIVDGRTDGRTDQFKKTKNKLQGGC